MVPEVCVVDLLVFDSRKSVKLARETKVIGLGGSENFASPRTTPRTSKYTNCRDIKKKIYLSRTGRPEILSLIHI